MPFQLSYGVPPECPNEAAFVEGVRSRLPAGFEASEDDRTVTIVVRVVRDGDGYSASVDVTAARGQRATRVVAGKSCENVIRGSALVTALALEARVAEDAGENADSEGAARTSESTQPTPPPRSGPAAPPTTSSRMRAPASTPPPARPSPGPAPAFEFLAGARGSLATGVAPGPAFGLGVFVGVSYRALGVGLTLERVRSGAVRSEGIRANYDLDSARFDVGASLPLARSLELEGIASFEGGVLGAEAIPEPPTVVDGTRGSAAWLAPGAGVRVRVLGGPVFVTGEMHGRVPLVQERFFVNVEGVRRVVYRVPYFSVGGALMLGARF